MPKNSNSKTESLRKLRNIKKMSPLRMLQEVASLLSHIEIFDILFVAALLFAIIKDFSDVFIGFIPIVGLVISLCISTLCAIFVFLIMYFLGAGNNQKIVRRFVLIFIGSLADTIPLVNFLPIETIVVTVCFLMILMERKEKATQQKEETSSQKENQQAYA